MKESPVFNPKYSRMHSRENREPITNRELWEKLTDLGWEYDCLSMRAYPSEGMENVPGTQHVAERYIGWCYTPILFIYIRNGKIELHIDTKVKTFSTYEELLKFIDPSVFEEYMFMEEL